jgi:hypothetical protein
MTDHPSYAMEPGVDQPGEDHLRNRRQQFHDAFISKPNSSLNRGGSV